MPDGAAAPLDVSFRAWPKADLHLHAMGGMRPSTIVELARRRDAPILAAAERGAAEGFTFPDLAGFVGFFIGLFPLVLDGETFERVTYEVLEDAARDGVRHVELRFTPTSHIHRGADERAMFDGICAGRRAAEARHGVTSRLVVDFPRSLPLAVAEETLRVALAHRDDGVVALDIAGDEAAVACPRDFEPVFRRARRAGLGITAHAGEAAGPESIRDAVVRYGATRVGHGTRAVEDEALLGRLARTPVVLEVCPSSNVALGVVPSVARHPVRRFVSESVPCVVATDDPTLFGTRLSEEFRLLHEEAGIARDELRVMARRSFEAAFLEPGPTGEALAARLTAHAEEVGAGAG